jgi:hypothetical protein
VLACAVSSASHATNRARWPGVTSGEPQALGEVSGGEGVEQAPVLRLGVLPEAASPGAVVAVDLLTQEGAQRDRGGGVQVAAVAVGFDGARERDEAKQAFA